MRPLWPLKRTSLPSTSAREEKEPTPSSLFNRSFRNHAHTVTHIYTHTWQHVCILTHWHTHTPALRHTLIHIYTHIHSDTHTHAQLHSHNSDTHSYMFTFTCTQTHTHTHLHAHSHTLTLRHTHSYTFTLTYTQTPAYCVSWLEPNYTRIYNTSIKRCISVLTNKNLEYTWCTGGWTHSLAACWTSIYNWTILQQNYTVTYMYDSQLRNWTVSSPKITHFLRIF